MRVVKHRIVYWGVALMLTFLPACTDDSGGSGSADSNDGGTINGGRDGSSGVDVATTPAVAGVGEFTYTLEQSLADLPLWTMPVADRVQSSLRPPEANGSGLSLWAARNEFEPVQLLLGPATGTVQASIDATSLPGGRAELSVVGYEGGWGEHLTPVDPGDDIALDGSAPVGLWLTVYVPEGTDAGEHTLTLTLSRQGQAIEIPVTLHVFDFSLPALASFGSQLNLSISSLVPPGGTVDDAKTLLFEHRFTPKSVPWPSGLRWDITWDNAASSNRCETFWAEPDESDAYSIGNLAPRYILGTGWNSVGFPNAMAFQFVDNSTPRPDTLCGVSRGSHEGTQAYNDEWGQYLGALEGWLREGGMLARSYAYVQNEPQDPADHALAAHLCRLYTAAAPDLRIAISEEPKPEIAEDPGGACGYDIWIAHIRAYQQDYAYSRQRDFGEAVWFYSLDHDPDPFFNPTQLDLDGMHQRIIPWVAWGLRITGWAYYDANRFFDGHQPGVRAELLREGFEDYEYLVLANGGAVPGVDDGVPVDVAVQSAASSLTSWTRDADALLALRIALGRYIESGGDVPVIQVEAGGRPRDSYFINFQDPTGSPTEDPLVVDGETYMKIGWQAWDDELGYGWYGENVDNPSIVMAGYDDAAAYSELERSYVYDDYGRDNLFEFALENGEYEVTVGVGRPGRAYPNDPHNLIVEGQIVVDDEPTTEGEPVFVRTVTIDLRDGRLSVEMGGRSQRTGDFAYTFMGFLRIVPVE